MIREFYDMNLQVERELAALYLGRFSAMLMRTLNHTLAFDVVDLMDDEVKALRGLDCLLYTHNHYDHYHEQTAIKIFDVTNCYVVAEEPVYRSLSGKVMGERLIRASPGDSKEVKGIKITMIKGIHVGSETLYLVRADELGIFHGGDSGYVDLKDRRADIAMVPTGDPSPTASPEDAFRMVSDLKPSVVIPIHGSDSQHRSLELRLKERMPQVKLIDLKAGKAMKIEV